MQARWQIAVCGVLGVALGLMGCSKSAEDAQGKSSGAGGTAPAAKVSVAYITNGVADFWTIAKAGAQKAGQDVGADVTVIMPANMTDQTRKVEDLLTRGTDGIAISVIDPDNQGQVLDNAAAKTNLITHDSDAPNSKRLLYIGMDNYKAGYLCGQLVREALPGGGKVMLFIGRTEQDNSRRRTQGCIDGICNRTPDSSRNDIAAGNIRSEDGKYTVLGVMTDQFDRAKGKANAEDALTRNPDLGAMVGLFEYNPPLLMEALDRAGKLGKVKVVAFDENPLVLQGIKDGTVFGTIVQNPYQYGYESVKVLTALHKGDKSVIPADRFIDIPARVIRKEAGPDFHGAKVVAVDAFWSDLKAKLSQR